VTVSGQIALDDLNAKAGLALPEEEFQTLSGLLVNQLGRVPYPGEEVALPAWSSRCSTLITGASTASR